MTWPTQWQLADIFRILLFFALYLHGFVPFCLTSYSSHTGPIQFSLRIPLSALLTWRWGRFVHRDILALGQISEVLNGCVLLTKATLYLWLTGYLSSFWQLHWSPSTSWLLVVHLVWSQDGYAHFCFILLSLRFLLIAEASLAQW